MVETPQYWRFAWGTKCRISLCFSDLMDIRLAQASTELLFDRQHLTELIHFFMCSVPKSRVSFIEIPPPTNLKYKQLTLLILKQVALLGQIAPFAFVSHEYRKQIFSFAVVIPYWH